MNLDRINQWLTLIANLGLVAGFILIAFQLKQNTDALRIQAEAISSSANIAAESAFMGETVAEAYAVAWQTPEKLTDAQMLQVAGYLNTSLASVQQSHLQFSRGVISEKDWGVYKSVAVLTLNWPFAEAYWATTKHFFDAEFVRIIDDELEQSDYDYEYVNELREAIIRVLAKQAGT